MELNHPMSIFPMTQQPLPHGQPTPQPYLTQRVPGFHSSQLYRGSDYYNSYEGNRQYSLTRMAPMSFPMNFQPEYKPYSQNLMQRTVHYDPGYPSPSDGGSMYPYPRPSSSSQYSYITSQTGTETFTQDGTLPNAFLSNQPALHSPSCSYAENHLSSSPVYLQNQSTPSYNKDHRSSLQQVVGVPQEAYGKMAAEDLFFVKASRYGIQVVDKQTGCKDMKVEPVNDSVKERNANLFKAKASQNGIMIESPQEIRIERSTETKKTLDLLPIAKEIKARNNNPNCSIVLDVQAKTNAAAIEKVQCYNNYGENVSLSSEIEVYGESTAKKAGSIYSDSWSAEKFTSILDTDNRRSKFTEQSRMSPAQIWMIGGRHEDISRDGYLEGIEQTVLDALNLQEVAWETEDDDALSWEFEMSQEEKVEGMEEGQNIGVELEDERIKEAAKCLVETIITGVLKKLRDEEHFSKEETKVDDYWSEVVTEGKEISTTEEQSMAKDIIADSVVHTLDDPGSVGDDPGLMSANGSSEIDKEDLKENMVFQKQPQNKEFVSALMNDDVIMKSTDVDVEGLTADCASKVEGQFERSCSSSSICFELNPESPEFRPGWKKIGNNWKKAINMNAPEEFRASLNAMTEAETVPEQYVDSEIQPEIDSEIQSEIDSEPFLENSQVIDDGMINFEAPGLGIQIETYLNVGQECEKSSASHKIALKLNTDCPEFKPESWKISTIRPDAPEFTPSLKTFFLPPHQDVTCKKNPKAKVFHLVMPKVVEKFKSVDIQASVEVKEASSLTRKVKTKDTGTYTGSCDCRDVCVNTLESMACEKSKFYIPMEILLHSTKSVSCGTEPQSTESIGINADLGSYKETELIEKLKQAQMELIQCRADLHVLQLKQTISSLKKEKKTLMEVFIGGEDKVLIDQIIDKRILNSRKEIRNIEVSAKSWVEQIKMGQILDSVPALLFQSETQGPKPAVGDFHQPVHMSPFKVNVSPVRGGFGAINIDSYKMDMNHDRVMASSKGPSSVDTIRTPIKRKMHSDLREASPIFGKSLKPFSSPMDAVQVMHSMGLNGQRSSEIMVSPRHRHRECSAHSTNPHRITSQPMGTEPRVQDSQATNTLPVKDWWYFHENIEDTRKAEKVQRSQSLVQKAEHIDEFKKESEGRGKNDVKMQGSDVEVRSGTRLPWHNMMLDRESSEDVEVKGDSQPPWHDMMLDREGSEDVEVKSDTQPTWHNTMLDRESSEDVEVKSDTQLPWHDMMLDREGSEDVVVKSDTQPPWHNTMLDREGSEDVEVKCDTQPPWRNTMLDRESSEDVEVKSDTQPPWHNTMLDREGSEDVEVKSDTQPTWHNTMLDREGSEDVVVKSDTQPPWHNTMLDSKSSEDVEVKSDTQLSQHDMMLYKKGSQDHVEGTKKESQDRDRQVGESEPGLEIIVNFNSALPIVKDETLMLAESVRKTEAVKDFKESKLSVCSSGFESRKVGSFDHDLEKDQDASSIKNWESKVIMDSEKDYVKGINTNNNNNDINVVNSDTLCSALKFEVSDFSILSKIKDVSSDKSQCEPISTKTLVHDLIVNSPEDSHLSVGTGETVIVNKDVTTRDLVSSNGHCSIAVDATDSEIISSSVSEYKKPLEDSLGITDPAIISVSGSKKCSQISHASVNEPTAMDGISSQKSVEQQTVVVSTAELTTYSESFKTKTESEVGLNLEVGNTRVKTAQSPVNFEAVLNLANIGVPDLASGAGLSISGMLDPADAAGLSVPGMKKFSPGLCVNPAEGFTPVPGPVSPHSVLSTAMPSLSNSFMPVFSMPQVQKDRLGMPSAPQMSTTSPPTAGTVLAAQKGIPDPAGGIIGVDPILYQTVLAQIMKAYPDLSKNSDMLRSLALQQTTLLQFYISGEGGNFNLTGPVPQSSVPSQLGTTGPIRLSTEFEGKGMNVLVHSDSKESTDIPTKPLAPPPGNLPAVFSSESSCSTSFSKGFDFTSAVESTLKPNGGASSSVMSSPLSFSFANTAGSFTATAKIDTKTKFETAHSDLHPNLSVTSKTDQVHSKAAQEDNTDENKNSAAKIETSTQDRISSSSDWGSVCHKNELDVLHKNEKLLTQDVESPKLSGSHLGFMQTKPSGSVKNLHGASSNREPPGQASSENKTFMPRPNSASYPVMPPWAAHPSILKPKFGSYPLMPLMAAQPQVMLPQTNVLSNLLPPRMAQRRVFHPHVMQPRFTQHQPQKSHFMTPQPSLSAGWKHGFPQSILGLPQNVIQQNVSTPADDHNDSTKGTSNHTVTREISVLLKTPESGKYTLTKDTSVIHRTPDSDKHNVTSDTFVPHKTPVSDKLSVTSDTSVPHKTPDSDKHIAARDTAVPHKTPDSDKHIAARDTAVPHKTPDSDKNIAARDTAVPHKTPDSDKHIVTWDSDVPHRTLDSDKHSITRDNPVSQRTPGSDVAKTSEFSTPVKSTSPADKVISNFVVNQISKSAEKLNVSSLCPITIQSTAFSSGLCSITTQSTAFSSGLCPITTQSTACSSKRAGVGSVIEPKLGSPFGSEDAGQPDFLPSFVKTDQYTSMRKPTPPISKTSTIPELMKTQSWRGATWETRENWDDEVDEYPEPFILKHNVKREITGFNGSYSAIVKTKDSKLPVVAAKVRRKNEETNSANPWASQVQGHQEIVTSNEKVERKESKMKKQEKSWTEVTKKKKKESSKHEPSEFTMTKLGTVSQTKASNFDKLIQKLMECFSDMKRLELIDVITQVRKSRGGSLSGMTMKDIVDKAREVIMDKQRHMSSEQSAQQQQQQRMFQLPNSVPANSGSRTQRSQSPYLPRENTEDDEDICVICHDGLSMEETKTLDCGHIFHFQCIKQWVLGRERTCPNCRSLALFPEEFPRLGK